MPRTPITQPAAGSSRLRSWLGAVAGMLGVTLAGVAPHGAAAHGPSYRPAPEAPAAWRAFALAVQIGLSDRLAFDDATTAPLRQRLAKGDTAPAVAIQVWVAASGRVERVAFAGLDDDLAAILRDLLLGQTIGTPPPPEMVQPLHLRLVLARHA